MNYNATILFPLLLSIAACGPKMDASGLAIFGGHEVISDTEWASAVAITFETWHGNSRADSIFCSGTLIHPKIVVTAAHCLDLVDFDPSSPEFQESVKVYIGNGNDGGYVAAQHRLVKAVRNPWYTPENARELGKMGGVFDSAYLLLETEASATNIAPILLNGTTIDAAISDGKVVTIVGFGKREDGGRGQKYQARTKVDRISREEVVLGGRGTDACKSDSGGPAYIFDDGVWKVFGIASRGLTESCGEGGLWGLFHKSLEWIQSDSGIEIATVEHGFSLDHSLNKFKTLYPEVNFILDEDAMDPVPYPDRAGDLPSVIVPRSYLAFFGESERSFVMTICHELGHHFGESPYFDTPYQWSSCEGQADYWLGNLDCLQRYWGANYSKKDALSDAVAYLNTMPTMNEPAPSLDTFDPSVVTETFCSHPTLQCRLDTIRNAVNGQERPRCWYAD